MEKDLYKLLYLLISIIYAIFNYHKKRTRQETPETPLPPSTAVPDWDEELEMATPAWKEVPEEAPALTHDQPAITPVVSVQSKPSTTRRQPKIERVLDRYKGWKKAAVMSELIRPYW